MESRLSSGEFGQLTSIRPIIFEFSDFALGYAWQLRDSVKACALIFYPQDIWLFFGAQKR